MCDIWDDGDTCAVWDETIRKARKSHWCGDCGLEIKPGDRYLSVGLVYDGTASTERSCLACDADAKDFASEHHTRPAIGSLAQTLRDCIDWDAKSAERWAPVLARLTARIGRDYTSPGLARPTERLALVSTVMAIPGESVSAIQGEPR